MEKNKGLDPPHGGGGADAGTPGNIARSIR